MGLGREDAARAPDHGSEAPGTLRRARDSGSRARQRLRIGTQRRRWSRRAESWQREGEDNAGLATVRSVLLAAAAERPGALAIDLGCGSGEVSVPLARHFDRVIAVDVSPAMIRLLGDRAAAAGVTTIDAREAALEKLDLPVGCADLVVSNYALHHLHDTDKARLVRQAAGWLRPGGRLIISDMMLGRGGDPRDRAVIREKVAVFARRGPAGWWRIAKNASRFALRLHERPLSPAAWCQILAGVGLVELRTVQIVSEAAMVVGVKPEPGAS